MSTRQIKVLTLTLLCAAIITAAVEFAPRHATADVATPVPAAVNSGPPARTVGGGPGSLWLPSLFGDGMVLQETTDAPVWGLDVPGRTVTVTIGKTKARAKAGADGHWRVDLRKLVAPGPYALTVADGTGTDTFTNVAVGEVWVCSGQSNMELQVTQTMNARQEIAAATDDGIRLFHVGHDIEFAPQSEPLGAWQVCSPRTVADFSAIGYYFARDLRKKLGVPVGVIQATWGGIVAEAFTPLADLQKDPQLSPLVDAYNKQYGKRTDDYRAAALDYQTRHDAWLKANAMPDPGNTGFAKGWASPDTKLETWPIVPPGAVGGGRAGPDVNPVPWPTLTVPGVWSKVGPTMNINGAVWLRRDVDIPASWAGKDLMLHLGQMRDFDVSYFNGVEVGSTGPDLPLWWDIQRRYAVPGRLVISGRNVIAVRIFNQIGQGGIYNSIEPLQIAVKVPPGYRGAQAPPIPLSGAWSYMVEVSRDAFTVPREPQMLGQVPYPWMPGGLWNGMIAPLIPYGMRGVVWYQGESNADHADLYRDIFPTMIKAWRANWGEGDFPFVFAQVATWGDAAKQDLRVPAIRDAQLSGLSQPNTAVVVTLDISEGANIHPTNKQAAGDRFALAAMALAYGQTGEYESPIYASDKIDGGKATLTFTHADGGLTTLVGAPDGASVDGFEIAGADKIWHPANAVIAGSTIAVSSPDVPVPTAVRYAWASNWDQSPPPPMVANKSGLPLGTFATGSP